MRTHIVVAGAVFAACSAGPPSGGGASGTAAPPVSAEKKIEEAWQRMAKAEACMRSGDIALAADTLTRIIVENSQSHEASTVVSLVRLIRQKGATAYSGAVSACSMTDVEALKKSLDTMERIARQYGDATGDKRAAIEAIFGPATFTGPTVNLEGLLNCLRQMEAARQKTLQG
jgi:hypothetical protein